MELLNEYLKNLDTQGKVFLRVKVTSKMSKFQFTNILDDGTLKLNIRSAPEKGKANKEIIKELSRIFNVSKIDIKIISGETSPLKIIEIKK